MIHKNKLRNTFLAASFCLLNTFCYAQTKEETIAWLQEKLEKHFYVFPRECKIGCTYTFQSVEINECEIKYKIKYWWGFSGGTTERYTYVIPTKDLIISGGILYLNYEGITVTQTSSTYSDKTGGSLSRPYKTSRMDEFGINTSGEVDINERTQKAITHLATFCPEKKKETF